MNGEQRRAKQRQSERERERESSAANVAGRRKVEIRFLFYLAA